MVILTVNARESYPLYLIKAIEIANMMLHYPSIVLLLSNSTLHLVQTVWWPRNFTMWKSDSNNNTNKCHIWMDISQQESQGNLCEWDIKGSNQQHNMNQDDHSSHEYRCIVFMFAVMMILHECAHLTLRWKRIMDSPDKLDGEVGNYIEKHTLFHGCVRLKIQKRTSAISRHKKKKMKKTSQSMD